MVSTYHISYKGTTYTTTWSGSTSIPSFFEMTDDLETEMYNVDIEMVFWIPTTNTGRFKFSNMNCNCAKRMNAWPRYSENYECISKKLENSTTSQTRCGFGNSVSYGTPCINMANCLKSYFWNMLWRNGLSFLVSNGVEEIHFFYMYSFKIQLTFYDNGYEGFHLYLVMVIHICKVFSALNTN